MQNEQTTSTEATSAKPVTYHDNGEAVTITLQGEAYANLRKIVDTMNAVDWCENDNTTQSVLANFIVGDGLLDELARPMGGIGNSYHGVGEITSLIWEGIDTGADGEEDRRMRDELSDAFEAAFNA